MALCRRWVGERARLFDGPVVTLPEVFPVSASRQR